VEIYVMIQNIYKSLLSLSLLSILPDSVVLATSHYGSPTTTGEEIVTYPSLFFQRYRPNTALDMVNALPGFQLNEGNDLRGFGGAAGNLLINDRRPSAKQDTISAILSRIPARNVERIEIIRGQVRGIDLAGYSVVANVFLLEDTGASVRWEVYTEKNLEPKPYGPGGSISLSDRWRETDYTLGFEARRIIFGDVGTDIVFDGNREITERRFDDLLSTGGEFYLNFNTLSQMGETLIRSNLKLGDISQTEELLSNRVPQPDVNNVRDEIFVDEVDTKQFELGIDGERALAGDLMGKGILLFTRQGEHTISTQETINASGLQTFFRSADSDKTSKELIGRTEFDWTGLANHTLQINLEGAFNSLDGSLVQMEDTGTGLVNVDVPGGNTRVEEIRGDFLVKDNWRLGSFEIAYGIGAEVSTITQTGDAELERSFFFVKPETLLTYSPVQHRQSRLRVAREVSQLNFDDFISATVFEDDDLALGNPDLQPEVSWIAELSHELRFGEFSVLTLTAFHHWISDVEDLLPLTPTFEAPGNIGDGRRWGLELEGTLPLDWLALAGARLDIKARWQDSTVTDPVTGEARVLSSKPEFGPPDEYSYLRNESRFALTLDYRQDFEASKISWGWSMKTRTERPFFKVNELEILNEGIEVNTFIETTRWFGIKARFEVNRVFDVIETRDRTLYMGERGVSAVDSFIERSRDAGRELVVRLSGTF
jgi:outer membrane receptor protein involved in Fe transport